ncbi:UDP-N-acetylmuramoyl-L-alanyl-D-glutamate--2,6-diaminopimelate ligase [Mahella australiensis]|uniref:UDP-N-acetylmuramoyl-L-alanyl-D-glutamate--2,6-diaminopimelate ligase n=1 Tax=Mahella australiensis (strain DSM 15567 / CIP 107919 / 50-1 BON) TaxID=697281 RepID=F3ZZ24_MAHA5|nr:UDP-N-acetylmuramoyl-L-alanyl-D-glutamate--2,6-diaminopimelate ligase [Mahella australiensis]AEE96783.1 UDP-N-acetylmuramoylalanyl-D-glutamate--2,6-diaminopimelate ligase [Mahella australiensis 50-1 BON]
MELIKLLNDIEYYTVNGDVHLDIKNICYDSRKVTPGSLFVAIEGFKTDGHRFIRQAIDNGAVAVVVTRDVPLPDGVSVVKVEDSRLSLAALSRAFYDYPDKQLHLIGVTGTNGKTSVTYMVKSILEQSGRKVGLIGTIQNMIGDVVLHTERTTPESSDLYALFRQMADGGIQDVVMEVSSHSLALNRVAGCRFDIGIFTNLTEDHLDFHSNMDDYFAAKLKLFQNSGLIATNVDDSYGVKLKDMFVSKTVYTYGIEREAHVTASNILSDAKGSTFDIDICGDRRPVIINIPGRFSVYNALAAAAACYAMGVSADDISKGLQALKSVPGRFEVLGTDTDFTVIIDYAHTPDGLENILKSVKDIAKGRVIALFGCGGDRDAAKRPIMGEIGGRYADFCILTSDNPRSEDPMAIIRQIEEGIRKTHCPYIVIENRRQAIKYGLQTARKDDILLLAGKGHETYQILKDKTIHFDEREVVRELLEDEKQ